MHLSVDGQVIKKALKESMLTAGGASESIAFKSIKLETEANTLKIFTQSKVVKLINVVPAEVEEEGMVVVPAGIFASIVNGFDHDPIEFKLLKNGSLRVIQRKSVFGIPTAIDPMVMSFMEPPSPQLWTMDPKAVLKMLEKVTYACRENDATYRSTVNWEPTKKGLVLTATDGFRLSTTLSPEINLNEGAVLQVTSCNILMRLLKDAKEFGAYVDASGFTAVIDNKKVYVLLSAARFPAYRDIFPAGPCKFLVMDRKHILARLKQMELMDRHVKMKLTPSLATFQVNSEHGIGEDSFQPLSGSTLDSNMLLAVGINFLKDALGHIDSDTVTMEIRQPTMPIVLRGDDNHLQLISPVQA